MHHNVHIIARRVDRIQLAPPCHSPKEFPNFDDVLMDIPHAHHADFGEGVELGGVTGGMAVLLVDGDRRWVGASQVDAGGVGSECASGELEVFVVDDGVSGGRPALGRVYDGVWGRFGGRSEAMVVLAVVNAHLQLHWNQEGT